MRFEADVKTFEEIYPKMPFSELIRLALLTATALRRLRDRHESDRNRLQPQQASAS